MNSNYSNIIPITELRRRFGEITENLAEKEEIILTKGGEPFAVLRAVSGEKRKLMKKSLGALKNTALDDDKIWKEVETKKSRETPVKL
jgi:prevent-host-death family protein